MKSVLVSAVFVKVQCFFSQRAANLTHSGQFMNFDPAAPDQAFMSYWYGAVAQHVHQKNGNFWGFSISLQNIHDIFSDIENMSTCASLCLAPRC